MQWRLLVHAGGTVALIASLFVPPLHARAAGTVPMRGHFVVGQTWTQLDGTDQLTDLHIIVGTGAAAQTMNQHTHEIDRFLETWTAVKVLANGSGQFKITFGRSSVTTDGKKVESSMAGVTRLVKIDTLFNKLSSTTSGTKGLPDAILSALPTSDLVIYPSAPIAVGGTWKWAYAVPGVGTIIVQLTLVAVTSKNGRQVATLHGTFDQTLKVTNAGITFGGRIRGTEDGPIYIDTEQPGDLEKLTLSWSGAISGNSGGQPVKGTFKSTGTSTTAPG